MADQRDTPETKDHVSITVDGKPVDARPGEMIIAAAERSGVYIPRFCYHPRMKPVGMCRMCLVHVSGPRGFQLQPACFVPVAEGQEIVTDSPEVKKAQDGILEFLLINHPLDCPVCDKGGECPLQDQTFTFGPGETRFVEEKRHWEKPIALSKLVLLDRERCIQCARCTRFADEIAGDAQIAFINRGERTEVGIADGHEFTSYFSGNTVQICPVGALLSAPYRFKARPWDLEQVESTCTVCAVGCRIAVQSSGNALTRYLGIDSDPVNHGWLCDKGRYSYDAVNSDTRITSPKVRKGDELVDVSWGEALAAAAAGLARARELHGPAALAVLGGARLPNEDAYAWSKLARAVLGTDNVDCQLGDGLPADLVLGLPKATIDEACAAPAIVVLAPDLKEELPVLYLRIKEAVESGVPLVEITPERTGLTPYASATLGYRPGEAARIAAALVDGGTTDVGPVTAAALDHARSIIRPGTVVILGRPSMAESAGSIADAARILDRIPGVRFLSALRRGNVHGALDMGLAPGVLPGRVSLDAGRDWYGAAWGTLPEAAGMDALGVLDAAAAGRIHGLVLLGADPLTDAPDRDLARRALGAAGFTVAVDTFLSESSARADVVLPAAMFAERPGTTTNLEGRITRLGQKIVPPGVSWADWMIAVELAAALGADLGFETLEDICDEIERVAPSHAGFTRAISATRRYRDGVVVPLADDISSEAAGGITDVGTGATSDTQHGMIDPMSDPGIDAVETHGVPAMSLSPVDETNVTPAAVPEPEGGDGDGEARAEGDTDGGGDDVALEASPAPNQPPRPALIRVEPADSAPPAPPLDAYSLRLVAGRTLYDGGAFVRESPALAALAAPARLRVNPYDLDRLGVTTGGRVRVSSPRGAMTLEVEADRGIPRGSAALPFNAGADGAADLIDAEATVTDVRVETV